MTTLTVTFTDGTSLRSEHPDNDDAMFTLAAIDEATIAGVDLNPYGE